MRIGIIIDGPLAYWQAEALRTLERHHEFVIYSCENDVPAKRQLRHALYYLLNLFTVRNPMTRRVELPITLAAATTRRFRTHRNGAWQQLPPELLREIEKDAPAVLIKFGMGLLTVPPADELAVPLLSYHHGDPAQFRGRPAGFYELLQGEETVGQIVQILSNKLDAGKIVAAAETKAIAHSYRATLVEAYRHSPLLLRTAVANAAAGISWEPQHWGEVYRLPGNATVLKFLFQRVRRAISHIRYGLFLEKRWSVATVALPGPASIDDLTGGIAENSKWQTIPTPPGYRFLSSRRRPAGRGDAHKFRPRRNSLRRQRARAAAVGSRRSFQLSGRD
jgi:hypothetical protein